MGVVESLIETLFLNLEAEMIIHLEDKRVEIHDEVGERPKEKKRKLGLDFEESDEEEVDKSTSIRNLIKQEVRHYRSEACLCGSIA